MKLLKKYFKLQQEIYEYFGYEEDWVVIPLEDATECDWYLNEEKGYVRFGNKCDIVEDTENYYENAIYRQCFLKKWVYRTKDYTMVCVDTNVDGNKFLQIFDNSKEILEEEMSNDI